MGAVIEWGDVLFIIGADSRGCGGLEQVRTLI